MSCACTPILLVEPGESYGKSACLCLGAIILFGKRRISSFFGPGNPQQLSCGQMCPWVLVLGLVVFAEVKVPVRTERKCGLCTCAAVCVAPRE